jgi:GTPase SAR1 family protein
MLHVLVYGAPKVGKTAWVDKILNRTISEKHDYRTTIAYEVNLFQWKSADIAVVDAGGMRQFRQIAEDALHDIHVVILMYDSTIPRTLDLVLDFYPTIPLAIPVILAATTFEGKVNAELVLKGKAYANKWHIQQYLIDPISRSSCLLLLDIAMNTSKIPRQAVLPNTETAEEEECFPQCCHPMECTIS